MQIHRFCPYDMQIHDKIVLIHNSIWIFTRRVKGV